MASPLRRRAPTGARTRARLAPETLFQQVEALARQMSDRGIALEHAGCQEELDRLERSLHGIQSVIDARAGRPVSLQNANDWVRLLHHELALPVIRTTGSGMPATDQRTLRQLGLRDPMPHLLLRAGEIVGLRDHCLALQRNVPDHSGRIHPRLDPHGTVTGRFTSRDPNLLGLPRALRRWLMASNGHRLMVADFSHFELRILAHLSKDKGLVAALAEGDSDPHRATAAMLFRRRLDEVSETERQIGKQVVFAVIYGQSARGLAEALDRPVEEAVEFMTRFFEGFPGVAAWRQSVRISLADQDVETAPMGRRSDSDRIEPDVATPLSRPERQAVHFAIQSQASEVFRHALARTAGAIPAGAHLLLPLHDAILLETPERLLNKTRQAVRSAMEGCRPELSVPLPVKIGTGRTWAECDADRS